MCSDQIRQLLVCSEGTLPCARQSWSGVADPSFQDVCVHGIYPVHWIGGTIGCDVPSVASVTLKIA